MGLGIVRIQLPKQQITITKSHLLNKLGSNSFKILKWGHTQSQTEWRCHKLHLSQTFGNGIQSPVYCAQNQHLNGLSINVFLTGQ